MSNQEIIEYEFDYKSSISLFDLKLLVISFLKDLGYSKIVENDFNIKSKRGSVFQNGFTFNPLKWKNDVELYFESVDNSARVHGKFKINIKKQIVTQKEISIWNQVLNDLENLVINGNSNSTNIINQSLDVKKRNIKLVLWSVFGAILGGAISTYLAVSFDLLILIPVITIACSLTFLMIGMRRNNVLQQNLL
ncbi:hypothetical protein [Maribacter aquivivus]|uniref:hypothetical protein n=1 Tax=Maribacter aquivivus TaxID=228958 RepID=UPI00248F48E3|nr:hypothetical protein [Maribacter aquivivus]